MKGGQNGSGLQRQPCKTSQPRRHEIRQSRPGASQKENTIGGGCHRKIITT